MVRREEFLPIHAEDLRTRGWDELDVLLISGDAYVDHPSFGTAIIGRMLEAHGYRVGIIAQPDWRSTEDFKAFGLKAPRLFVGITSGNLDSMVNHFTAAKNRRKQDAYSPGGVGGRRPDRALIVYANRVREVFGNVPIVIGGIEASLRRFAHYDYWQDAVRRSILLDSKADLLVFGMGEKQIVEIADSLASGISVEHLDYIPGTVARLKTMEKLTDYVELPSFEEVSTDKEKYARAFKLQAFEQDSHRGRPVIQKHGEQYIIQNRPAKLLTTDEMDRLYEFPYAREYHPVYEAEGGIPALQEVKFSIVTHRGCYGSCAFCALASHQGKVIQSRSKESILKEVELLTKKPDFKGVIHDVGGPTANMYDTRCERGEEGHCGVRTCLYPSGCANLQNSHRSYIELLRAIRQVPGVNHVFIRSGIRFDLLMEDQENDFLSELVKYHVSGQLKIAPEHVSPTVLKVMRKPKSEVYAKFRKRYEELNQRLGKEQFLVPYFISSHPGSGLKEMVELAEHIRDLGYNPEQVQDFTPTPMTLATCMYYTEMDPFSGKKVYVPKSVQEKRMQRALLQFRDPKNYDLVKEALHKAGRLDLIGYGKEALIPPMPPADKRAGAAGKRGGEEDGNTRGGKRAGGAAGKRGGEEDGNTRGGKRAGGAAGKRGGEEDGNARGGKRAGGAVGKRGVEEDGNARAGKRAGGASGKRGGEEDGNARAGKRAGGAADKRHGSEESRARNNKRAGAKPEMRGENVFGGSKGRGRAAEENTPSRGDASKTRKPQHGRS